MIRRILTVSVVVFSALVTSYSTGQSRYMPDLLLDQAKLYQLLVESEVSETARSLVHLSHTCSLLIGREQYPVIDMRELIRGAVVPRGVNQIIVLNPGYQLVKRIEYGSARPLFCEKNKLYLHGNLIVDGQARRGNVLQFEQYGFKVYVLEEDLNKKLPLRSP